MVGLQKLPISAAFCFLLLCTLFPSSEARRGRGGGGFGGFGRGGGGGYSRGWGGQSYRPAPVQRSGPSAGKVAGAAAAGAIGGAMIGSALSRPGYGYGYGGYGAYGPGYGPPRYGGGYGPRPGYEPEGSGDMEYYTGASSGPIYNSIVVVIGFLTSLLLSHWVAVV
ncbi:shadow of prion protein 2 [Nematolebias whitei]|uniref:shadow of prion protein 2 n=1 Tax=Nematolebias whitei TaxID=451745 RepID=UPI001898D0AD|nr:shadow of prion protein 2 [Nematolebias whitei]